MLDLDLLDIESKPADPADSECIDMAVVALERARIAEAPPRIVAALARYLAYVENRCIPFEPAYKVVP